MNEIISNNSLSKSQEDFILSFNNFLSDDTKQAFILNNWRYFCMGNALVVGLIEKMGKTLSK